MAICLAIFIGGTAWFFWPEGRPRQEEKPASDQRFASQDASAKEKRTAAPGKQDLPKKPASNLQDSFLDTFEAQDGSTDTTSTSAVAGNAELEKQFAQLVAIQDVHQAVQAQAAAWSKKVSAAEYQKAKEELERVQAQLDKILPALDKEIARARKARPNDPVPEWLTAELLIYIGSEPELIFPHLERALKQGLDRPRLLASLARVEIEANQPAKALETATKALEKDQQDRYVWKAFSLAAFNLERYTEVSRKLSWAFPSSMPEWAKALQHDAQTGAERLHADLKLSAAGKEELPRVKFVVEHRRFARGAKGAGGGAGAIESTGRAEFILELYEDQAPIAVANFIHLVENKLYDGTRFYLAESATLVAGGDPKSKTGDPLEDGTGGPGYAIPDEYQLPNARKHFRGSISMVNIGPNTAGSQFFITLAPRPEMDGRFTVFGRVIEGIGAVDAISRGRTNPDVGRYGQIIPGDLLVRAEVLRKRKHEYKVIKAE